jgi:molybdopterin synthase catalytic subunit
MKFTLAAEPIEPAQLRRSMLDRSSGAFCAYEGWVRDLNEGKSVQRLEYKGYAALAPRVAHQILAEAEAKYRLRDALIVHRTGLLEIGDIAVWVGVTAHHRGDTFLACRYIIDNVKYRLPVWKREMYTDGSAHWIENPHCDAAHPDSIRHSHDASAEQAPTSPPFK